MREHKKKRHTYTVCLFSALRPSAIFLYAVRRRRFTPSTDTFIRNACSTQLRPRTSHSAIHCASSCGKSKDWIHAIALLGAMLCSIARISRCSWFILLYAGLRIALRRDGAIGWLPYRPLLLSLIYGARHRFFNSFTDSTPCSFFMMPSTPCRTSASS